MYALATSGAISGINACVLPRTLPSGETNPSHTFWQSCWRRALDAWDARTAESVQSVAVGVRVATWNVGEVRPGRDSIKRVLGVADNLDRCVPVPSPSHSPAPGSLAATPCHFECNASRASDAL